MSCLRIGVMGCDANTSSMRLGQFIQNTRDRPSKCGVLHRKRQRVGSLEPEFSVWRKPSGLTMQNPHILPYLRVYLYFYLHRNFLTAYNKTAVLAISRTLAAIQTPRLAMS